MLCAITGIAGKPDGTVYASATFIIYRAPMSVVAQDGRVVAPIVASVVSEADGSVALSLLSGNYVGVETASKVTFPFTVPETATADWADCVELAPSVITPTFPASQLTGTLAAAQEPAHTGDVTNAAGSLALTIAADAVTNAKLANMATARIKGRSTAGTGDPEDLTAAQAKAVLAIAGADVTMTGGGTAQDYVGFATRAAFVTWAEDNDPAVGCVIEADGLSYEYDGTSTIWLDLPGWKLAIPRVPATAAIYAPAVTVTNVGDLITDLKYNSMAGLGRKIDGALFAVWNGNDTPNVSEGGSAQDIYMSDSTNNGASFGAKYKPFKGAYASNPFTGVGAGWMQAVPLDFGGKSWVVWTCGRGATDQGPMLSYRTNGLWTNTRLMQRTADGAIVARSELLNADAPAGYTMLWNVDGVDWFAYPQWMKSFDGVFYMGITLTHPTDGFSIAAKRSVVAYSTDGGTFALGEVMPMGVIQDAQSWEWDVIRLPNGSFRAYIRVNFNYVEAGDVGSTPSMSYKFAMAESPDLMGWTSPTFMPMAVHVQRLTTTQMPNGFWGLALPDDSLSRNNQSLSLIRDGGSIGAAVPVSNEVVASQWAHTGSAFYDSVTGKVMVIWSAGYNSGAYTAPSALRVSILGSLPSTDAWNVIPQAREDEPTTSGTVMSFASTASAGLDLPLNDYTITFPATLNGGALAASETVVICSVGSAQAGLQVQYQGARIEVVPVANGRAGAPIETLPDGQISVTVMPDHVVIGSERYWMAGSGEFHLGDYHETGSDLATPYLSIDVSKIRVSRGAYGNPLGDWWSAPKPSVIENGNFANDTINEGADYTLDVGVKLNDWRITTNNGATGTIARGAYTVEEADAHGGVQTYMRVQCTAIGGTVDVAQRFAGANFLAGQLATLSVDLHNADGDLIPVLVLWQQSFGTGGSSSAFTSLGTLFVDGSVQRQDMVFVIPELPTGNTVGAGSIGQLIFRLPFDATTADLHFSNVELSAGIGTAARAVGAVAQETVTDATANRAVIVGGFGIGGVAISLTADDDLDDWTMNGWAYNASSANTTGNNYPVASAGALHNTYRSATGHVQQYTTFAFGETAAAERVFVRSKGSAGWAPWVEMYHQGTILGTVSQTGGVPTGAVIEQGSNGNGRYTKYADGTLICYRSNASSANPTTWTFPVAFSTAPTVTATATGVAARIVTVDQANITATTVPIYVWGDTGGASTVTHNAMAIGRWF